MSPEDQYPSTDDCAAFLKKDDDAVLLCLENARARYIDAPTRCAYISGAGSVCAIGAVWAVGNGEEEDIKNVVDYNSFLSAPEIAAKVDEELREEAKEAIALLNAVALDRHPEAAASTQWSGPLEWVNQSWAPPGIDIDDLEDEQIVFDEVTSIYDEAIERRRSMAMA